MRLVRVLALIVADGVQPFLEILLLPDLFLRRYRELPWWRLMHIEVLGFYDNDGLTAVRPDAAMRADMGGAALIAVWPYPTIGTDMRNRVAAGPDAAIRA